MKTVDQPLTLYKPAEKPAPDENADPAAAAEQDDPATSDIILTEARHILSDYISLEKKKPLAATTTH